MKPGLSPSERVVRCAIYTRKSSDEGLEQSFNSLDAQREACAAYILSQASEGWSEVAKHYDDGGLSGGTLERPALQQLLGDIAAGLINIIVVYKVDRLTRSLLDFAKLVEAFDKAQVSFVSITQSFNTTTSIGRLTLNMLLSFAQFEREVTAERIRDKIAASKAKGMWMGGVPPIGYAPSERTLVIVEEEAALVHDIYRRYLNAGSVHQLQSDLEREGIHVPVRKLKSGKAIGGGVFSRGQLYHILKNATYVGRIVHRDTSYEGLHPALLDRSLWDAVQQRLAANVQGSRERLRVNQPSLLAGRIVDEDGQALIASHACKGTQRYRYYIAAKSNAAGKTVRIPARQIEQMVIDRLTHLLADPIDTLAHHLDIGAGDYPAFLARAAELSGQVAQRQYMAIRSLVTQVRLTQGQVVLSIDTAALASALGATIAHPSPLELICEARLTRSGRPVRLIRGGDKQAGKPDPAITQLLVRAHRYWQILKTEPIDITRLAEHEGINPSYLTRILRLAFLAPDITEAMLAGDRMLSVNARQLTLSEAITADWATQRNAMIGGHDQLGRGSVCTIMMTRGCWSGRDC